MSRAETRQEIADALSTVAAIQGYPARPDVMSEGDAWPQWRGSVPKAYAREHTWAVLIVLPSADDVSADSFADEYEDALADALRPVMTVDSFAPAEISTEAGPLYALLITGRSE